MINEISDLIGNQILKNIRGKNPLWYPFMAKNHVVIAAITAALGESFNVK